MARRTISKHLLELSSANPRVKYHRAKQCATAARKFPARLYPYRRYFFDLLESDNNILKWTAIDVVGYLSRMGRGRQICRCVDRLAGFLSSGHLITANHAIAALTQVALAHPRLQDRVTQELLSAECYTFETDECRNIVMGKVIEAFAVFVDTVRQNTQVLGFVGRQLKNGRAATRKRAEAFIRNVGSQPRCVR